MEITVPVAQDDGDNMQYMLHVSCDKNSKGTCIAETIKSDYFDEKTENLSAPFKLFLI